ncbi:MAG: hypothetical protein GF365_03540 [Candidatus Buchananbacteria bacterium]|nr:hypothetical protein [Candidatus Buchananbacteria bacterium]
MVKSQIKTDKIIRDFLDDSQIKTFQDVVNLKNKILKSLEFRSYNQKTKKHADSIQWQRTASQILKDGYVYKGKACSDLAIVFLALCKTAGLESRLVKLISLDNKQTHSIAEFKFNGYWYRIDPSVQDSIPFKGALTKKSIWNKRFKVYKKGRDVWELGLSNIEDEKNI